ncbi:SE1561 family protein [Alteribacillus sp. YIM 98480]|uniref:SE1561 family protein n=1 Tax=Alteribacillus sp. YIM 98480 TaxID=2606599 RepID=UPI00131B34C4|nr:SE1561 family protein [Alteribacillus sp. YIM 98480]
MSSPVHNKKRQLKYLRQRVILIQEMVEQMEETDDVKSSDLERLDHMFDQIKVKIKQFKQDWD